uniref:Fibronectin type-III domain-containing protein n=1 Tax=Parascaris equorum TaxID=6256 RepID=A0A914RJZ8_PAREQ
MEHCLRLRPNTAYRARIRLTCDFAQSGWSMESAWMKTLE